MFRSQAWASVDSRLGLGAAVAGAAAAAEQRLQLREKAPLSGRYTFFSRGFEGFRRVYRVGLWVSGYKVS